MLYTLTTLNEVTSWFDLRGYQSVEFNIVVSGSATATLQIANDETYSSKSDVVDADTYSASVPKVAAAPLPKFARLKLTAVSGGSVTLSFGSGVLVNGELADVRPESESPSQAVA